MAAQENMLTGDHISAALGEIPCDLVADGRMINTATGKLEDARVAIYGGKVVGFGDYKARKVVKAKYLCPALIDAHVHIESGMLSPFEFSKAVAARGTCAVIADPHEVANVSGFKGLVKFIEESRKAVIKVYFMAPSCVPASPLEMSYGHLSVAHLKRLYRIPEVLGLGEVMDYVGVLRRDTDVLKKLQVSRLIDGHAPGLVGRELNAYMAAGIDSDHETSTYPEALEKLRKGMWLMVREGSCSKNLKDIIGVEKEVDDTRRIVFATDDRDTITLDKKGHIDDMVRMAIKEGIDPVKAVQMATINPAARYGLKAGVIMPGRDADIILLEDLDTFKIKSVLCAGRPLKSVLGSIKISAGKRPVKRENTVVLPSTDVGDITIKSETDRDVRVIGAHGDGLFTEEIIARMKSRDGAILADARQDIVKLVSVRRYPGKKMVAVGFIKGFGIKRGAMAQTICHDSHNIMAVGVNDLDIITAITRLGAIGGGIVAADDGKILSELALPYAGLMSDKPLKEVSMTLEKVEASVKKMGCGLEDPVMTLSFMGLSVIPELKLTCGGLVSVKSQKIVSVFAS